jgi:menaquinone-dependent protoporphyrinogen oxidase
MKVLVTYASPHGSTRGIAERIGARLGERGLTVDCQPMHDVAAVTGYDVVIAGSAIHNGAWLPEAIGFVAANATQLAGKRVWLFSVGMPGALARPLQAWAMREGPKAIAPLQKLVPVEDSRLFSGVVSKHQFPMVSRLILRAMGGRYGDFRDWVEIDAWAGTIADVR